MTLYADLMLRFPGFKDRPGASEAFAEDLDAIPEALARRAAFGLLAEDPRRLPNGMEVRHRVIDNAGLLAPSFAEARRLHAEVSAGRLHWRDLPGPVMALDEAAMRVAEFMKPHEEAYADAARTHDRRVLAPGGIGELVAAGEWLRAVWERRDRVQLARQCAAELRDPPALLPGPDISVDEADGWVARWETENGVVPALASGVDPDEAWGEPAPRVAALIAARGGLRRVAAVE